jgi:hypothetical protein
MAVEKALGRPLVREDFTEPDDFGDKNTAALS